MKRKIKKEKGARKGKALKKENVILKNLLPKRNKKRSKSQGGTSPRPTVQEFDLIKLPLILIRDK
jgi:hypothetical protein